MRLNSAGVLLITGFDKFGNQIGEGFADPRKVLHVEVFRGGRMMVNGNGCWDIR